MNIPAHLAQELLAANFKNICAKLEAGGTLTSAERATFEKNAAKISAPSAPVVPAFTLDPSAPLPAKLRNFFKFTYAEYATGANGAPNYLNSKDGRTVKRWVSYGRHCKPPDLPPLDEPNRMADWHRRSFPREPVPAVLLSYEAESQPAPDPPRADPSIPADRRFTTNEEGRITSISLDGMEMDEGEQVRQARSIAKANFARVQEASSTGNSDDYRRWFPVWKDSVALLRVLEKEDREARKASGDLVPRGPVLAELSQLMEALRIMRDGMEAKILAELEKSAAGRFRRVLLLLKPLLRLAVASVRAAETEMFRHIESLTSAEDVKEKIAA